MVATNEIFRNLGIKVDEGIPNKRVSREVRIAVEDARTQGLDPDEIASVLIEATKEAVRNRRTKLFDPKKGALGQLTRTTNDLKKENYRRDTIERNRPK
ncbi:hypothetical protein C4559_03075 [Candidatus Microgenomates bacterium]|nr:MAG: hypothetical protein C4559_03075 [Candidatus Microgenomates bacterium]